MDRKIYLCYRRVDSADAVGWIYSGLVRDFKAENVFRDVDSVSPGEDFRTYIARAIAACSVFLVIIGPHWLDAPSVTGQRRIDDPSDFIRREIELALEANKAIVPILVGGARIPSSDDLPASIRALAYYNALAMRGPEDYSRLSSIVEDFLRSSMPPRISPSGSQAQKQKYNFVWRLRAAYSAFVQPSLVFHPEGGAMGAAKKVLAPETYLPRVFISHSHLDNLWCREFVRHISNAAFRVWFDETDMRVASTSFIRKLEKEVLNCNVFVVILTANSVESQWVNREFDLAMQENKIIVPVLQATADIHGFLKTYHQVEVIGLSPSDAAERVANFITLTLDELKKPEMAVL